MDFHTARALLEWQIELGAIDAIGDEPVDRYGLPKKAAPKPDAKPGSTKSNTSGAANAGAANAGAAPADGPDPVQVARDMAGAAQSLEDLQAAMGAFDHCELRKGARNLVFSDGVPGAPLMIIGEAPGRDEDREGRPFVGRAGQLLDRMLAAIGHSRSENVYITNVIPWRPPQNRDPSPDEIAMMQPFLARHVELAAPRAILLMGNISCQAVLGRRGILRLRGTWVEVFGRPAMPMTHPAYLLRTPTAKREAWADLLAIQARLRQSS